MTGVGALMLLSLLATDVAGDELADAPFLRPEFSGLLADRRITEASGLAVSRLTPERFWVLNDGGNGPMLFAISPHGKSQGTIQIDGVGNIDWEDLASFTLDGTSYLAIGDVGDNGGLRKSIAVHLIEEPIDPAGQLVQPVHTLNIRLEDGPHDIESIAVDQGGSSLLLLTKRIFPAHLYRVPIDLNGSDGVQIAVKIAEMATIPQPTKAEIESDPKMGRYRSQPTGMDLTTDGRDLIVLTYRHAYLFRRSGKVSWAETFSNRPALLKLPPLPLGEAIAYGQDGRVLVTTERWPAPVISISPRP